MDGAAVDRPGGGDERLPSHLAAEHTLTEVLWTLAPEDPILDPFEVEELHQPVDGVLGRVASVHENSVPVDWIDVGITVNAVMTMLDGRIGPGARYLVVSAVNVVNHQVLLALANSVWGWPGGWANAFAATIALVPAYFLTRAWVWTVNRAHSIRREVLPFFALAAAGLVVSSATSELADRAFGAGVAVNIASLLGYLIVWIAKFFILERIFSDPAIDPEPVSVRSS